MPTEIAEPDSLNESSDRFLESKWYVVRSTVNVTTRFVPANKERIALNLSILRVIQPAHVLIGGPTGTQGIISVPSPVDELYFQLRFNVDEEPVLTQSDLWVLFGFFGTFASVVEVFCCDDKL